MSALSMPARGHATAPKFDPAFPRDLSRYFSDLDLLFATCGIQDDFDKKKQALRYVDIDTADLWELLPEHAAVRTVPRGSYGQGVYVASSRANRKGRAGETT
jgi:hypothetical protein